jgi:uncharacterized protein (TIGR00375 family)
MDTFLADLHIHSRFSRATSKQLSPANLAAWGGIKGLDILGTGDFTHPKWLEMLEEQFEPGEDGLLYLKKEVRVESEIPWLEGPPRRLPGFVPATEISSIYKKNGRVRKVHNLVFMPGLEQVRSFNRRLGEVGNLNSDGRPILGLDSRNLLEMVLETDPAAFLIPAHIWTPWFSLFGSKSGFDTVEECFEDLSDHIFALETGLSSDPEMNWLLSVLDKYRLVSNSDAHSGEKLGREANIFAGERSYFSLFEALHGNEDRTRFEGTLEFFPEEGKYHLDGHRKCGVVLDPRETIAAGGICPVCGRPVTVGVLNRVMHLADRESPIRPAGAPGFVSLVPLPEILSEILGVGPKTKKVRTLYVELVQAFGSEMDILRTVPPQELGRFSFALPEALRRMRSGRVIRNSGYDGAYGTISMFTDKERREFRHGKTLAMGGLEPVVPQASEPGASVPARNPVPEEERVAPAAIAPNREQQAAIDAGPGPVLVLAGPGTGKTQTLMGRVNRILNTGTDPGSLLILTFTRRAARELRERLARDREGSPVPRADTLHALAYEFWTEQLGEPPVLLSEETSRQVFAAANPDLTGRERKEAWNAVSLRRERLQGEISEPERLYTEYKAALNLVDYTDLLEFWLEQIGEAGPRQRYAHVLVDEIQDLSLLQLRLVISLAGSGGRGFFGIGDPRQSIYGFRGAIADVRKKLKQAWPGLCSVSLAVNYRSVQGILDVGGSLFPDDVPLRAVSGASGTISWYQAPSASQECSWIARTVREALGGTGHWQADREGDKCLGPGDIAVLVRFRGLIPPLARALTAAGVPCAVPEQELFFHDPRVGLLLREAARILGVQPDGDKELPACPDAVFARGPLALSAYLTETPPFDPLFWKSRPFRELERAYREHGGWAGVLSAVSLEGDLEGVRSRAQKVQVMTLHAAKGLEFELVFLPALEEGILPFAGAEILAGKEKSRMDTDGEEERRLFYVGLTRARQGVYLSSSGERTLFGRTMHLLPSSLLKELPGDRINRIKATAHIRKTEKQLTLF